jgi:hypothetical protein
MGELRCGTRNAFLLDPFFFPGYLLGRCGIFYWIVSRCGLCRVAVCGIFVLPSAGVSGAYGARGFLIEGLMLVVGLLV